MTVINLYVTPVLKNVVVLYICNATTLMISSLQREVRIHRLNYVWCLWVKDTKSHPEQALTAQFLLTWRFCNIRTHTNSALKEEAANSVNVNFQQYTDISYFITFSLCSFFPTIFIWNGRRDFFFSFLEWLFFSFWENRSSAFSYSDFRKLLFICM